MFFHKHLLQTATGKIPLAVFFWKEFAAKENIKITLFYSENSKNSQNSGDEKDPALLSQGRANFLGANKESSLPPQENEFVFDTTRAPGRNRTSITFLEGRYFVH